VGGKDLYLRVMRERDQNAIHSEAFRKMLLTFKHLQPHVDAGSPDCNWNDATALLIPGKDGVLLTAYWDTAMPMEKARNNIAALRN
jgi:glucose/mannose transport system substrate-binding protein